jgi:formamidopyrimidine-DNA glycosylase
VPELPEVETVVRTLAPKLTGRRILDAQFFSRHVVRQKFPALRRRVRNQPVKSVRRHGKFIVLELEQGVLSIHLGMTGKLLFDSKPGPYARAIFELDEGLLVYDDIRHFGRIEWSAGLLDRAQALGPDALDVSLEDFLDRLKKRNARIKPLLLNQTFVRGMGNIYTDEALFEARIHPLSIASSLSKQRATRLHRAMVDILATAIRLKGSSISDYVDADRGGPAWDSLLSEVPAELRI